MSKREVLEGLTFGDLYVKKYLGQKRYLTVCNKCGAEKEMLGCNLKNNVGVTCHKEKVIIDLEGEYIGEWHVLKYVGNKKYLCRCSCGVEKEVLKVNLINGSSTSCGHNKNHYGNLLHKKFGEWTVIGKEGYKWKCQCSCGAISYKDAADLVLGKTKSCGHGYNEFTDISGQQFGLWHVLEYVGNQKYKCQCSCENKTIAYIRKADLLNGQSTSCGCNKTNKSKLTMIERYCEVAPNKTDSPRTLEQIQAVQSKENMKRFIDSIGHKPLSTELADLLGLKLHRTLTLIHKYELEDYVSISANSSHAEYEIIDYISSIYQGTILHSCRDIITPKELDIYIPEKKVAIEFNGTYWHSTVYKDKYYHQQKTIDCARKGIQLIHIFEYEWENNDTQQKIKNLLSNILSNENKTILHARKLKVKEISSAEAYEFENKYHLQNKANSRINIALVENNEKEEIQSIMTFDRPRFSSQYQLELIRICTKANVNIVGGLEKMFSYFLDKYTVQSIITYCDISKFKGNSYTRIGFKVLQSNPITEPNYKWIKPEENVVLSRYQTQKSKLISQGLGTKYETEDEIMENNNFLKVYDCGNIKLHYIKEEHKE